MLVVHLNGWCSTSAASAASADAAAAKAVGAEATAASAHAAHGGATTLGGLHALTLQLLGLLTHLLACLALLCLTHGLIDLLLVRIHLNECLDLRQIHALPIAKGNNFVKGKYQIECVLHNLLLVQRVAVLWDLCGKHIYKWQSETAIAYSYALTTLENRRSVSKSSSILLAFVVMSSI